MGEINFKYDAVNQIVRYTRATAVAGTAAKTIFRTITILQYDIVMLYNNNKIIPRTRYMIPNKRLFSTSDYDYNNISVTCHRRC